MSDESVRVLIARWEQGIANLFTANEEERVRSAARARYVKAETMQMCVDELRAALAAPESPVTASSPLNPRAWL